MYFASKKVFHREKVPFFGIFVILAIGIYGFFNFEGYIRNFRPYHVKSYLAFADSLVANTITIFSKDGSSGKAVSIPILFYHGILGKSDGFNASVDAFKGQMFALKRAGYETISIEDFYNFKKGIIELPERSFLLTFDDGRKDSYYPVQPILEALDYHAVMFAITRFSISDEETPYYLNKKELREMLESGRWDIQSHGHADHEFYEVNETGTKGHFMSNRLWIVEKGVLETEEEFKSRIVNDLTHSKQLLEDEFKKPVIAFAFPFGDFGHDSLNFPRAERIVPDLVRPEYPLAFYETSFEGNRFTASYAEPLRETFFIKRIEVRPDWTGEKLLSILEAGKAKPLPYSPPLNAPEHWITTWGKQEFLPSGETKISASELGGGSVTLLDGSRPWSDYEVKAGIEWQRGNNIYVLARYQDDRNFAACNFGKELIHIEQTVEGVHRVIKGEAHKFVFPENDFTLGMRVDGRHVECFADEATLLSTDFLDPLLDTGGIGFKTWDPAVENSELLIRKIRVSPIPQEQ